MQYFQMNLLVCAAIVNLVFTGILANESLLVSLNEGLIKGLYRESHNGRKFIAFEGIPYARPPIGNLRFEDPQPVEPWLGVLEAVNTYACIQSDPLLLRGARDQEDCLYINVYVPREKLNPEEKLDVIVHIHGGGFMLGSPIYAGPDKLMDRDVVYVNFNYRLGPFGFYSIGDGRGNYGMKDQTAALQWIQDNIDKFGGNKDSVTITGMSAGGASVHLHYFSKLSRDIGKLIVWCACHAGGAIELFDDDRTVTVDVERYRTMLTHFLWPQTNGLFHKGFAQSGMALNPWATIANPEIIGIRLANEVGCSDLTGNDVYECMKQRPASQIAKAVKSVHESILPLAPFAPTIEANSPSAFLSKSPYSQLVDKEMTDVPLLVSMAAKEGTAAAALTYRQIDELNENWKKWFPLLLEYSDYEQEKRDEMSEKIREFYFNNSPITTENYDTLIEACSHRMFLLGGEKSAILQAEASQSNIYFLVVNYTGEYVPVSDIPGLDVNFGAGHGIDLKFYYTVPEFMSSKLNKEEENMKDVLLDMMIAFAKTGNPNTDVVNIRPLSKNEELNYLLINGPDDMRMEANGLGPHEFWSSLGLNEDENE